MDNTEYGRSNASYDPNEQILADVQDALRNALRRATDVADQTAEGLPKRLSQVALSEQSGVARSTIAKYLAKTASGGDAVNPDLKLLCKIANHLNVPPAFLLMRKEDWQRLAHAMGYLLPIWQNPKVQQAAKEINDVELAPAQQAMAGENIAKQLNLHAPAMSRETFANSSLEDAVNYRNMRALLGLRTTCALPPLETMSEEYHFALLYICASVGANPT